MSIQNLNTKIKEAVKQEEDHIISDIIAQIKDSEIEVSPDCNIDNAVVEIMGDIDIDYNPECKVVDIDEVNCFYKLELECYVDFKAHIEGDDLTTASYDKEYDTYNYIEEVKEDAYVHRTLNVIIRAHYNYDDSNELYIDDYKIDMEPIIIERGDYDDGAPFYK